MEIQDRPPAYKLDNPMLRKIFDELSIEDMWTAGRACARFYEVRPISASLRPELTLLTGSEHANYHFNKLVSEIPEKHTLVDENGVLLFPELDRNVQLRVESFPLNFSILLANCFEHLTDLTISFDINICVDSVNHLLTQYNGLIRTSLRSLKLFIVKNDTLDVRIIQNFLQVLNSMGTVKKLILYMDLDMEYNLDLPILAHLEEFKFYSEDYAIGGLKDSILRYASNNQNLRSIGICVNNERFSTRSIASDINWFQSLSPEFASRFTDLRLDFDEFNGDCLFKICQNYNNLTSLSVNVYGSDYIYRLYRLGPMPQMENLIILTFEITDRNSDDIAHKMRRGKFPTLPSVKMIIFNYYCFYPTHRFLSKFRLDPFFPNVQVVRVNLTSLHKCTKCNKNGNTVEQCSSRVLKPFARFQQLRTVSIKPGLLRQFTMDEMNNLSDSDSDSEPESDLGDSESEDDEDDDEENALN